MRAILSAVAFAAVAFVGAPAWAQSTRPPPVPNPPLDPKVVTGRGAMAHDTYQPALRVEIMQPDDDTPRSIENYNHMLRYSECAVKMSAERVATMLAFQPNSNREKRDLSRLVQQFGGCGPSQMLNILTLERGALSEALYKSRATAEIAKGKISATSEDSTGFLDQEQKWNHQRFSGDATMIDATNCLVAVQPALANAILYTRHGSDEEAADMDKLFSGAPMCAGAERPDNLSKSFLRAFIADSLYRLSISDYREKFLPGVAAPLS